MQAVYSIPDLRRARASLSGTFGLVPTMGALHEGHLSLVQRAREECDRVGVSIFVNPAQFGANEDLDRYPRDPDRDLELLETHGADLVWIPAPETVYPPLYQTWITVEEVSKGLEGRQRPGHFRGVATVVAKLFNLFLPDRAYFGQKDAQQIAVVKRMAADLNFPVEIVVCPTVRAPDGLALSSRNRYLSPEQRRVATVLHRALASAAAAYGNGERSSSRLCAAMMAILTTEPLACAEYVSAADPETLVAADCLASGALLSLAVRIGNVRLIDNRVIPSGDTYAARS
jgi:pantoate--beta-alanine ligase